MSRQRARRSFLAVATLLLTACAAGPVDVDDPASVVAERFADWSRAAEEFGALNVGPDAVTGVAVRDGATRSWNLTGEITELGEPATASASVPFADIDPAAVQNQVEDLARQCAPDRYRVTVQVVTETTLLSELRCGAAEGAALFTSPPVTVLLNGEPLPDSTGLSWEESWAAVLELIGVLDPELSVGSVTLTDEEVSLSLSDRAATNGCRPSLMIGRAGDSLAWACRRTGQEPGIALGGFSAADLATLQSQAMDSAGITAGSWLEVTIDSDRGYRPQLRVRSGAQTAAVPLS